MLSVLEGGIAKRGCDVLIQVLAKRIGKRACQWQGIGSRFDSQHRELFVVLQMRGYEKVLR